MGEGRASPTELKDSASEKAEDTSGSEPLLQIDPAEAEDPTIQTGTCSPSLACGLASSSKKSDSCKDEGDRQVSAPALLEGMVFYITDYTQSMEAAVIQKWKQVSMHSMCVCACVRVCSCSCLNCVDWNTTHHCVLSIMAKSYTMEPVYSGHCVMHPPVSSLPTA